MNELSIKTCEAFLVYICSGPFAMTTDTLKLQLIERLLLTKDKGLLNKIASLFKQETDVEHEDSYRRAV